MALLSRQPPPAPRFGIILRDASATEVHGSEVELRVGVTLLSPGTQRVELRRLCLRTDRERGMLSNARCLGEGVDVPTLDGIAFIDPKQSQVDIVQAVGRAMRKSHGKTLATIVIPVFVDGDADGEAALDESAYQEIASVLRALRDHDAVLADELDAVRRDLGARPTSRVKFPSKVVLDLPLRLETAFSAAIEARLIRLTTASWDESFGQLTTYVQAEGDARVPKAYRTADGARLGTWVHTQRRNKDSLSAARRERLEALDGWVWSLWDAAWEEAFGQLTTYVQAERHARVPAAYRTADGAQLGSWVQTQRSTKDSLSAARRERLEALDGWVWDPRERR